MALSYQDHIGDGSTRAFTFSLRGVGKGYWDDDQIRVEVNGAVTPSSGYSLTSDNTLELTVPPPVGALVRIRRVVSLNEPYAVFKRGTDFTEKNMNRSFQQTLYAQQMILDGFVPDDFYFKQNINFGGNQVKNLKDGTDPEDAVTVQQLGKEKGDITKMHKEVTDAYATLAGGIKKLDKAEQLLDDVNKAGNDQNARVLRTGSEQNARLIKTGGEQAALSMKYAVQSANSLKGIAGSVKTVTDAVAQFGNQATVQIGKVTAEGTKQVNAIKQEGGKQLGLIRTESSKQVSAVVSQGNNQNSRVVNTGNAQFQRIGNLSTQSQSVINSLKTSSLSAINTKQSQTTQAINKIASDSIASMESKKTQTSNTIDQSVSTALATVTTKVSQGVASVDSAKTTAVNMITNLPKYTIDYFSTLQSLIRQDLAGKLAGKEGRWKVEKIQYITPSVLELNTGYAVGATTGLKDFNIVSDGSGGYKDHTYIGNLTQLNVSVRGVIVCNGRTYELYTVAQITATGVIWRVQLHPKYGDIRSIFTIGSKYQVVVFKESNDILDLQTDKIDVAEYFAGTAYTGSLNLLTDKVAVYKSGVDVEDNHWYQGDNYTLDVKGNDVTVTYTDTSGYTSIPFYITPFKNNGHVVNVPTELKGGDTYRIKFNCSVPLDVRSTHLSGNVGLPISKKKNGDATVTIIERYKGINHFSFKPSGAIPKTLVIKDVVIEKITNESLSKILPAIGAYGTLNAGFWYGKNWKSQLLGDLELDSTSTFASVKLGRKCTISSNTSFNKNGSLHIRGKNGWIKYNINGDPNTAWCANWDFDNNQMQFNVANSLARSGYASIKEMLQYSAVKIEYQAKARVFRPSEDVYNMTAADDKVYLFGGSREGGIPTILYDTVGTVPTEQQGSNVNWTRLMLGVSNAGQVNMGELIYKKRSVRYGLSNAAAVYYRLGYKGGKVIFEKRFKELILDSDWGDNLKITNFGSDYITTTTDDNGNVILQGVVSYNTGIPYK